MRTAYPLQCLTRTCQLVLVVHLHLNLILERIMGSFTLRSSLMLVLFSNPAATCNLSSDMYGMYVATAHLDQFDKHIFNAGHFQLTQFRSFGWTWHHCNRNNQEYDAS